MGGKIKLVFGLILLSGPIFAGYHQFSPLIIIPFVLIFTIAKITEKPFEGRVLLTGLIGKNEDLNSMSAAIALGSNVLGQVIVVGIFFAIAFGISSMMSGEITTNYGWYLPLALSGMGVLAAVVISRHTLVDEMVSDISDDTEEEHSEVEFMDRWVEMGNHSVMMPVEIFSLARDMADCSDRGYMGDLLVEGYEVCDTPFQRRVFFTYIRFAEGEDLGIDDVETYILDGLSHDNKWVAYDAAWAYGALAFEDEKVNEELRRVAADNPIPNELSGSDASGNYHKKVHKVLENLS